MAQQFEPDYGTDLSCVMDLDPMMSVVSGPVMMAQVCIRRLVVRKGSLLSDPLYGIDVRDLLGARFVSVEQLQGLIINELLRDERIESVEVVPTYNVKTKAFSAKIQGTGSAGPFSLVLSVADGQVSSKILGTV